MDWFTRHPDLPLTYKLFRQYCLSPAAATDVERLWSAGTYLDQQRRARMGANLLRTRLWLQKNLRAFAAASVGCFFLSLDPRDCPQ